MVFFNQEALSTKGAKLMPIKMVYIVFCLQFSKEFIQLWGENCCHLATSQIQIIVELSI
mgnify:CR=1 FL=1